MEDEYSDDDAVEIVKAFIKTQKKDVFTSDNYDDAIEKLAEHVKVPEEPVEEKKTGPDYECKFLVGANENTQFNGYGCYICWLNRNNQDFIQKKSCFNPVLKLDLKPKVQPCQSTECKSQ